MKTVILKSGFIALIAIFLLALTAQAQSKATTATVKVKTSAVCSTCKQRTEQDLSFAKGVKNVTLELPSQIATVEYDTRKTDADAVRKAITLIGYDADQLQADAKAYKKLPACCKKDNAPH